MSSQIPMTHVDRVPSLSCIPGFTAPVLESVSLDVDLEDLLALVEVRQGFANRDGEPVEAVYTFPVPRGSVLLSFTAKLGENELVGRIMPAAKAEGDYEEAVAGGDAAILLQEAEPGLYTVNIGNLLPGETALLTYRYAQLQYWQADTLRFALPTVVAPRYGHPSQSGLQPHQEIETDYFANHEAAFSARIRGALLDAEITCRTHAIAVERQADQAIVRFADGRTRAMDRDIVLQLRRAKPAVANVVAEPAAAGGEQVALLTLCPGQGRPTSPEGRFVKILVDCSGSMAGASIGQARDALRRILDSLRPQDHFAIVAFGSTHRNVTAETLPGTREAIAAAREAVATIHANMGGTELGAALVPLLARRDPDGRQGDVLLVTDGELADQDLVGKAAAVGGRIFTVGVGCAPGESLLSRLSEQTGGAAEFVTPGDDVAARIHRHFQRLFRPRVTALEVTWPGTVITERRDRDGGLFAGDTVHLRAHFRGAGEGEVAVRCELEDGTGGSTSLPLRRLAATAGAVPAASLLERLLAAGELRTATESRRSLARKAVVRLTELAVRCELLSPWTSCLMVALRDDDAKTDGQPSLRKVAQMPAAGWAGHGAIRAELCCSRAGFMEMEPAIHRDTVRFCLSAMPESVSAVPSATWTLGRLAALGVPQAVIEEAQHLVAGGHDEELTCLLLLRELLQAGLKLRLGRDRARLVRRGAQEAAARDPDLAALVARVVAAQAGTLF